MRARELITFQSSFYKDALWNFGLMRYTSYPHRFQSSFYKDALWNWKKGDDLAFMIVGFQSSFYKDALWNSYEFHVKAKTKPFQSSFYKDALWNDRGMIGGRERHARFNPHFTRMRSEIDNITIAVMIPGIVSILILQGCALKSKNLKHIIPNKFLFQSSFYKDALWNRYIPTLNYPHKVFQSSFYKDALWNKNYDVPGR